MKALIAALILALLSPSIAGAASFKDENGVWREIAIPPTRYYLRDYPDIQIDIEYLNKADVTAICSWSAGKYEDAGCASTMMKPCRIIIAKELPETLRHMVRIHETAHCNGWPADHPVD